MIVFTQQATDTCQIFKTKTYYYSLFEYYKDVLESHYDQKLALLNIRSEFGFHRLEF